LNFFASLTAPWLHVLFEALAYVVAGFVYRAGRKQHGDTLNDSHRATVLVAAILGAALGSKLLHHLASPSEFLQQLDALGWSGIGQYLMGGKTIVGAVLGGWWAVEWVKKRAGVTSRTGDLFAFPLAIGIIIGRLGCLFAGPTDDTLGVATTSWLGIDFGDGVLRYPTPLFEIFAMCICAYMLQRHKRAQLSNHPWTFFHRPGDAFRLFMLSYLALRLFLDFLKPYEVVLGLRIIQWACLCGIVFLMRDLLKNARSIRNHRP
jgi:phosphatidylglycerol:prolipoprotein diacylglycerol transferase